MNEITPLATLDKWNMRGTSVISNFPDVKKTLKSFVQVFFKDGILRKFVGIVPKI